jgi:hypothetical protein
MRKAAAQRAESQQPIRAKRALLQHVPRELHSFFKFSLHRAHSVRRKSRKQSPNFRRNNRDLPAQPYTDYLLNQGEFHKKFDWLN